MAGKRAKFLDDEALEQLLAFANTTRAPLRNRVIVLLSVKAGLRASEIAKLTWPMLLDAHGAIGQSIELQDRIAKMGSGRSIPIHASLKQSLSLLAACSGTDGPVIKSERGGAMTPLSIVVWFSRVFKILALTGCSSHSGRRTFITRAARLVHKVGGSLRDVQLLAGHQSIKTTEGYIDGDGDSQRRLIRLI